VVRPRSAVVRKSRRSRPWLILPAVAAVLIVSLLPAAYTLFVSLQPSQNGFQALQADPSFWEAVRRTLLLAAVALPVELLLGLALAAIFAGRMPGKSVFVALMALPALLAPAISGSAWRILMDNDYGPFNQILGWITGHAVVALWTTDSELVLPSILIADIWQWTPFMFLLILAGLTGIDRGQREAAEMSDAGPWRFFLRIVLPAAWPAIAIAVFIRALGLLRLFDIVWTMTRGGPDGETETLSVFAYEQLLRRADPSATAAMAFAVIVTVTLVVMLVLVAAERR
jgi:multiple sugar transport system permease protein